MASIVTEILSSSGDLEKDSLGSKITALIARIDDMKIKIQDSLTTQYEDLNSVCTQTTELASRLESYSDEVDSLTNLISHELYPDLQESSQELREIRHKLETAKGALNVVNKLVTIHEALEESETSLAIGQFVGAIDRLDHVSQLTPDLLSKWSGQVRVLTVIKTECTVRREKIHHDLNDAWRASIAFDVIEAETVGKDDSSGSTVRLIVHKSHIHQQVKVRLEDVARALHRLQHLDSKLKFFASRLHEHVIVPTVMHAIHLDTSAEDCSTKTLTLSRSGKAGRPKPDKVFARLNVMLDFLCSVFGDIGPFDDSVTEDKNPDTLMSLLGSFVRKDLYDLLIRECLIPAVPSQRKGLDEFANDVLKAVTVFHKRLVDSGLVAKDDTGITDYACNVDALFANKMCQEILIRARKYMLRDLHEAMVVPGSEAPSLETTYEDKTTSRNVLKFPTCQISKSAYDLVQLLYKVMEEATASSSLCAARIYATARNASDLYCDIVPNYHKDSLETLPQQAALFHNNCMYISHHLRTIGQQFCGRLPSSPNVQLLAFVDLIPRLSSLGSEVFLGQMRHQRKQLMSSLGEAGGLQNIIGDPKFELVVKRAVKQCILQLQHLHKVWHEVLPSNVYKKAIGTLVNSLLDEIVQRVVVLEDLPAENATKLVAVFSILTYQCPLLFPVSDSDQHAFEIHRYVPRWAKFQELMFLLTATMMDILDRWSEGKGPLAQEFTVDNVKQMIRALFQNTDRRAAVLSKIK